MFSLTPAKRPELFREKKPMKIRCDVCDNVEASVFCSADEAALCDGCDRHVHLVNKLASKHLRFSLLYPSSKQSSPLCDICQERRAFVFCQEDRAILCRECDLPIHRANEYTKKHNRFLLTGVELSTSSSSSTSCSNTNMIITQQPYLHNNNNPSFSNENFSSPSFERSSSSIAYNNNNNNVDDNISISTSSISEYLETLPGWQVDDLLDPSITTTDSFYKDVMVKSTTHEHYPCADCKVIINLMQTKFENLLVSNSMVVDQDFESQMSPFSAEDYLGFWVSDQQQQEEVGPVYNLLPHISSSSSFDGLKESKEANNNSRKVNSNWKIEDALTVPEIMSHRTLWKSRHFL